MQNKHHHSRSRRVGLSLLEVLVAIVILTTGALAAISTQVATAHLTKRTRALQFTAQGAARLLDSLRSTSCASTSGVHIGSFANYSWSKSPGADVALVRLQATPAAGKPWSAKTLVICP